MGIKLNGYTTDIRISLHPSYKTELVHEESVKRRADAGVDIMNDINILWIKWVFSTEQIFSFRQPIV